MFDPGPGTWSFRKQPRSRAGSRSGPHQARRNPHSEEGASCFLVLSVPIARFLIWAVAFDLRQRPFLLDRRPAGPAETRQSRTDLRRCGSVFKRGPAVGPRTAAGTHFFREAGDAFSRTFLSYWLWWESNPCPRSPKQGPPSRRLGTAIIAKREGGSGVRVQPERRPTGPPRSNASSRLSGCRRARLSSLEHGGSPFRKL